ncbi:MAG: twin-arginine translocase TatA/TatE family subunit [Solirubrobacteraceae bacterium]|nr:twin-arginine translocase TatA/TatE family subunit [Solirubrobacteraceae bacterium]
MPLGPTELIIILVILLLLFGAKRLPELGRSLGGGMREFKDSVTNRGDDDKQPQAIEPRRESPVQPTTPASTSEQAPASTADPLAKPATPPPTDAG